MASVSIHDDWGTVSTIRCRYRISVVPGWLEVAPERMDGWGIATEVENATIFEDKSVADAWAARIDLFWHAHVEDIEIKP